MLETPLESWTVPDAFAMGPPPGSQPSGFDTFMSFVPIIAIFVIFYFLLIRPQHKKQREHQKMLDALKEGDNILTTGGIYGTIVKIKDNVLTVQISENIKVKVDRGYVASLKQQP
jgi:preprotein translocase subunit YajC